MYKYVSNRIQCIEDYHPFPQAAFFQLQSDTIFLKKGRERSDFGNCLSRSNII